MVRIIKGQGTAGILEHSVKGRSKIIDGDTFNATILAREILDQAEKEKSERIDLARRKAENVENDAYEATLEEAKRTLLQELVQIFCDTNSLYQSGKAETKAISQEIVKKIVGDAIEVSSEKFDRALQKAYEPTQVLRVQVSPYDIDQMGLLELPSFIQMRENSSVCATQVLVETDAFEMRGSLEAFKVALNASTENG